MTGWTLLNSRSLLAGWGGGWPKACAEPPEHPRLVAGFNGHHAFIPVRLRLWSAGHKRTASPAPVLPQPVPPVSLLVPSQVEAALVTGPLMAMKCPSSEPNGTHSALQRDLAENVVAQVAQHSAGVGQLGAAQVDLVVRHHPDELKDLLPAGDKVTACGPR